MRALLVGSGVLAGFAWFFCAAAITCWDIPVGRWYRRAADATMLSVAFVVLLLLAYAIGAAVLGA